MKSSKTLILATMFSFAVASAWIAAPQPARAEGPPPPPKCPPICVAAAPTRGVEPKADKSAQPSPGPTTTENPAGAGAAGTPGKSGK